VVDARQRKFLLPKDVNDLDRFTPFKGDIPTGSVVLVGFLTGAYERDSLLPGVSYNLQFVAVLGNGNMAGEYMAILTQIQITHRCFCRHGLSPGASDGDQYTNMLWFVNFLFVMLFRPHYQPPLNTTVIKVLCIFFNLEIQLSCLHLSGMTQDVIMLL
jgi:hypothetical protein